MPALTVTCITPPPYSRPPRLKLPGLDVFEQVQKAITDIPDPVEIMSEFMDKINMAIMPFKKYLQVLEAVLAIKGCIEAIPKAILYLSPSPIYDCFKNLIKAIAPLIQDIPPISIIQAMLDICAFFIDLIRAIITTLNRIDAKITLLTNLEAYANGLGDIELIRMKGCGMKSLGLGVSQILDLLRLISPIVGILLGVILKLIPTPAAQRASNEMLEAASTFGSLQDQLNSVDVSVLGFPQLEGLGEAMRTTHNAMVLVYNIVAPLIGEAGDKQPMTTAIEWTHF